MPQAVTIQFDSAATGVGRKVAGSGNDSASEAFSAELNKQLQPESRPASKTAEPVSEVKPESGESTQEAATVTETEKTAADDGKNLPADETQSPAASDEAEAEMPAEPSTETPTEPAVITDADSSQPVVTTEAMAVEPTQQTEKTSASDEQPVGAGPSDKPVRAEVDVSQQAVDHAKAAPVAMTAKTPQQSAVGNVADNKTATPTVPTSEQSEATKSVNSVPGTGIATAKTDFSDTKALGSSQNNNDSKPVSIRADILNALDRQNSGEKEVPVTLRNLITDKLNEQRQNEVVPKELFVAADKPQQRGTASLNSAFSLLAPAASATAGSPSHTAAAQIPSLPIQPNMQSAAWSKVMSSRVVWMAKEGVQQAELRLTPANLGPVEVRMHVQNDQASVTFLAPHAATRDALEQALPRLRDSFAESGIELAHAEVGEHQHQEQQQESEQTSSNIFTQATGLSDDIEDSIAENMDSDDTLNSGNTAMGVSLYA